MLLDSARTRPNLKGIGNTMGPTSATTPLQSFEKPADSDEHRVCRGNDAKWHDFAVFQYSIGGRPRCQGLGGVCVCVTVCDYVCV